MSRPSVFFFTFVTYAALHIVRASYSVNKSNIQKQFGLSVLFLGFIDFVMCVSAGIGTFLRYLIINPQKPTLSVLATAIPTAIGFVVIPIISLIKGQNSDTAAHAWTYVVMTIAFGVFGFFQLDFFPAILTIFSYSFSIKDDGQLVGIWAARGNIGTIIGFFLANLLIYTFDLKWQYTMILFALFLVLMSTLLFIFVKDPDFKDKPKITFRAFLNFFKKIWAKKSFRLYIMAFSFFKAVLYTYELWTSKFLVQNGYKQYSGYVPMVFQATSFVGTYIMGYWYGKQANSQKNASPIVKMLYKYKFFLPSIIVIIICCLYIAVPGTIAIYFVFGGLIGLFLGAISGGLENNQIMKNTANNPTMTDMVSTINFVFGSVMVGVCQLVVGAALYLAQQDNARSQAALVKRGLIYLITGGIGVIASGLAFWWTCYQDSIVPECEQNELTLKQKLDNQTPALNYSNEQQLQKYCF